MTWDDGLRTGIPSIDDHHRRICNAIDLLEGASFDRTTSKVILDFIFDYIAQHFVDEEMLMEIEKYPAHEDHRLSHITGFDRFVQLRALFLAGKTTPQRVAEEFRRWVHNHVLNSDKEFVAYLRSKTHV